MDELLTPAEVAERTGVTPGTARQWMADDKVPGAFRFGATYLVATGDLRAAMEAGEVGLRSEPEGNGPPAITSRQAMVMLGRAGIDVSHVTVLEWLRKNVLPGRKVGKAWAVDRAELEQLIVEGFEVPKRGRPSVNEIG